MFYVCLLLILSDLSIYVSVHQPINLPKYFSSVSISLFIQLINRLKPLFAQMTIDEVVQDDNCNSCAVHYNLSRVSSILPLISIDDAVDFFVQLCTFLTDQEKHNVCKSRNILSSKVLSEAIISRDTKSVGR